MKTKVFSAMLFGCMLLISGSQAALYSSDDLLNGTGDFETAADRAVWELWNTVAGTSTWSTTMPYSGSWSWHAGPAVASTNQCRVMTNPLISTVANREHKLMVKVRSQVSTPSWVRYNIGSSGWLDLAYYSSNWGLNTKYYTTTSTENAIKLTFNMYANSANDNIYIDAVTLNREVALPNVDAITGSGNTWTLTNAGGRIGDNLQLVAFDPDVTVTYVSGFDVGAIAATWNSDNELVVGFENSLSGTTTLQITNPNGAASYMVTIPEPATIAILALGILTLVNKKK